MQRSRTQRSLADQWLDKYFTPGKYSRNKTVQQKSTDKLKKEQKEQKDIQKHQNRSAVQNKQASPSRQSQSQNVKIEDQIERIRSDNEQAKTMELSQQCRKILMKMQRFDRYLYPILSEKEFRQPIDTQVKRLERVKNQKKEMWKKTYDTQLLITALFNHIKLVIQMNRQLQDRQNFKNQVKELQKKIYQLKNDHKKQMKTAGKATQNENLELSKQEIITVKKIIVLLQQENSEEAQIELKKFVGQFQKVHSDLGRLCELFRNYIYDYKTQQAFLKQSSIKKLITNIESISQSLTLNKIQDLKKTVEKLEKQEVRDHAQQKILVLLTSIISRFEDEGKFEKRTTKSEAAFKIEKKQIQRTNRTDSSRNKDYQKQINRLKGQLERANREQKRLQAITKEKTPYKKQTENILEGQNNNAQDQTIITLQNDIKMLKKDVARLEQDNRTKALQIHNLTKHGKDLEIKLAKSSTPTVDKQETPQKTQKKSMGRSIKSQKAQGDQDNQMLDRIIKALNNKQDRDKLLAELRKKGIKNRHYILLDSIIKVQKNMEGKATKVEQSDQITKNHLTALLNLIESQSDQHWWTNKNPIPNPNNFKNGTHSVLINRVLQKVKEVYKIWSVTQNQNMILKRDIQDYKDQVEIIKIVRQEPVQIKAALKAVEKKFPKLKQEVWEKPTVVKELIQQQFSKKQLRQLLSVRQDFQNLITFVLEQLRSGQRIESSRSIRSSRQIKSVSPIKTPQDDIHKTNLDSINAFSQKASKLVNKGESWQKELVEIRKSMQRSHFLNFLQSLLKSQRAFQLRIQKLQQSESSAKEHLNLVIDLLQSEQSWWKNKNPVALNYKDRTLSTYIYKITDHVKSLHQEIENKSRISQKQSLNKPSESEQELKSNINYITQTIKNILKKTPKLKNQICADQKYLVNLFKSDIAAGKRQLKQFNPLLSEINSILLEAANIYVSNHNEIIDKVEQKTNQLEKDLKDNIRQIQELQLSLVIKDNRIKKVEHSKQLQNTTFNGEVAKLKSTIQNLLKQQKSSVDRSQSQRKNTSQNQKKIDQLSQQNKNLSKDNQRMNKQMQRIHADLTSFKQKQKDFKTTERENQKIKNELQAVREELKIMKQKVKSFNDSKESLAMSKHDKQIQYQNSISQLEMLNKITQEKLQYAEKKKSQLAKQILKKEEQIKFEVQARKKDKAFYDKMKLKLQNQISQLSDQLQVQRRESNKTISELTLQKNQIKKDLEIQQANSKDKITQLYLQLQKGSAADRGILDLKRQFQKVKTQLSQNQKNHQIETQELRKYIAKMNADMQTLVITKDQEKRVLRQQIQLVRQEQTNQYFKKTKKLQQQNRNLKEEQSRLIYIVESNESNFNALVQENRILIEQVEDLKRNMTDFDSPGRQKDSDQKIILLENKLKMFQSMMEGKSDIQEYQKALRTIDQISRDNRDLKDQLRSLERRERQSQQLNLSRSNEHSQSFMETFAKYERTLTENAEIRSNLSIAQRQVKQLQSQIEKINRNNESLSRRIEQKNQQIYNLQRIKNQFDFKVKQSEKILMFTQTNLRRQIQELSQRNKFSQRPNQQESFNSKKQKQLQNLKQSQYSLRILLEEKNLRIQNLMSQNYSVRLTLNEKQKIIQTNDALSKIQRQRVTSENEGLVKVNTKLQEQFARKENQYRQQVDRIRHDCIKYEEELRSLKEISRRVQFEFEENRKSHYSNRDHSPSVSTVKGYEQNFHKLITDNNEFRSQVGILQLSLKHKDQQIEELRQKLNDFKNRLNEKVKEIQQKSRINGELNNQMRDVSRQTQMQVSLIQFEKKSLQSTIEDLQREKRNLNVQIEELRRALGQKIQLENELQKLRKASFEYQNHISTINFRIHALETENNALLIEKQKYSSDYSNPEREMDRIMEQMNILRRQQSNLRHSLDRKQQQLRSARNEIIELQFRSKQSTQKIKFEKMSVQQQLSLLKSKYETLNSKYNRERQQINIKHSQSQRKIYQYQSSNDSQLAHTKKLFEQEKRQSDRLRGQIEKLKIKNTQLLNLNKQIKEINQQSIRKLHRSISQKHQLEFYSKANQELVLKVNQKIHQLKQENHRLRNGGYINGSIAQKAQSSYQGLLIKIRQLQSRLLHEQDTIYKLQHENRKLNNEKIMLDLEVKRISRDIQIKNQDILELRQSTANNVKERYNLSQKVENLQQNSRQQNTYLKTIMSMLNADGYSTQKDDLSEIEILLRISMEVEELIKSHRRLQNVNRQLLQQRQRLRYRGSIASSSLSADLAAFGKQLVDSLFDFLFERGIFTSGDIMKMKASRQSVNFLSHQNHGDYFQQLEDLIKDVLQSMIDTQRRHIQVHRNVLKDVKYLLDDFFKTKNNDYLVTIKRSLESSLEF